MKGEETAIDHDVIPAESELLNDSSSLSYDRF